MNEVCLRPEAIRQIDAATCAWPARDAGLDAVRPHEMVVPIDREHWEAIADYAEYSQGALHCKFPDDFACVAMRQATREACRDPDAFRKVDGAVTVDGTVAVRGLWVWVTARRQ